VRGSVLVSSPAALCGDRPLPILAHAGESAAITRAAT
jgi:hypothetical protein